MTTTMVPELRKAVKEYYKWNGDRHGSAVRIVSCDGIFGGKMPHVLAHVTEENGEKISTLMEFQEWKDGHFDVTEIGCCGRECEQVYLDNWRKAASEARRMQEVITAHPEDYDDAR